VDILDLAPDDGGAPFTQGSTHWSLWVEGRPVAALGAVTEARAAQGEVVDRQVSLEALQTS
jgi:hypothetical protein